MFNNKTLLNIDAYKKKFKESASKPFCHIVLDDFLDQTFAEECREEFLEAFKTKSTQFVSYSDPDFEFNKHTLNNTDQMPPKIKTLFESLHTKEFVSFIEKVTDLGDLKIDSGRWGAGLHATTKNGYLAIHRDFTVLPTSYKKQKQYLRVLNIIGYLTDNSYSSSWGGELELWHESGNTKEVKIEPKFNRWVLFDTRGSFHGHPHPYLGESPRISIAVYYYQELEVDKKDWKSTEYLKLPWKEDSEDYKTKRVKRANAELRYKKFLLGEEVD